MGKNYDVKFGYDWLRQSCPAKAVYSALAFSDGWISDGGFLNEIDSNRKLKA
jgi:hypothetical protein